MAENNNGLSLGITIHAEREMSSFMKAVTVVVGQSGPLRAGEVWLHAMGTLDWPEEDHEKFFRRVSILAISRLLTNSEAESADEMHGATQRLSWLPTLRPAI
jgi:hypothetical protein